MMEAFPENAVIEIQMWEAHVISRSGQNAHFFVKYSIDGPLLSDTCLTGRIAYRFTRETWFSEIKLFLIRNRIPVTTQYVLPRDSFFSQSDLFEGR